MHEAQGALENARDDYVKGGDVATDSAGSIILLGHLSAVDEKIKAERAKAPKPIETQKPAVAAVNEQARLALLDQLWERISLRDVAGAQAAANELFALNQDDYGTPLALRVLYDNIDDRAREREILQRLMVRQPKHTEPAMAEFEARGGNVKAAIALMDQLVARQPDDAAPILQRGNVRLAVGDHDGALGDARKAAGLKPKDGKATLLEAEVLTAKGDKAGGLALMAAMPAPPAGSVPFYLSRAQLYYRLGEEALGFADLNQDIEKNPSATYFSYGVRGDQLMKRKEFTGAAGDMPGALTILKTADGKLSPLAANQTRADLYTRQGLYSPAIADYAQVIMVLEADVAGNTRRLDAIPAGTSYRNNAERRLASSKRSLALAYAGRATALTTSGKPDAALDDATAALAIEPGLAAVYEARAAVYRALGDSAKANADFARARQLSASD